MHLQNHWSVIELKGHSVSTFLQGLFTNNIQQKSTYGAFLNPKGRLISDAFIHLDLGVAYVVNPTDRNLALADHLGHYAMFEDITVRTLPQPATQTASPLPKARTHFLDPRHPNLGTWNISDNKAEATAKEATTLLMHRFALGIAEGIEIPERSIILEYGLQEHNGISWEKGCYVGQELMARTHFCGEVRRCVAPITYQGQLQAQTAIYCEKESIGVILNCYNGSGLAFVEKIHVGKICTTTEGPISVLRRPSTSSA